MHGVHVYFVFKGVAYLAFTPYNYATMVQLLATVWYNSFTMAKPFDPPTHYDTSVYNALMI